MICVAGESSDQQVQSVILNTDFPACQMLFWQTPLKVCDQTQLFLCVQGLRLVCTEKDTMTLVLKHQLSEIEIWQRC